MTFGKINPVEDKLLKTHYLNLIYSEALPVAQSEDTFLIFGPTGSGKDVFANFIHNNSNRKGNPFIKINSANIPDTLFESEFCGSEHGSYTGSIKKNKGFLEQAEGGTLFLDEIGRLPLLNQAKSCALFPINPINKYQRPF